MALNFLDNNDIRDDSKTALGFDRSQFGETLNTLPSSNSPIRPLKKPNVSGASTEGRAPYLETDGSVSSYGQSGLNDLGITNSKSSYDDMAKGKWNGELGMNIALKAGEIGANIITGLAEIEDAKKESQFQYEQGLLDNATKEKELENYSLLNDMKAELEASQASYYQRWGEMQEYLNKKSATVSSYISLKQQKSNERKQLLELRRMKNEMLRASL